MVLFDWLVVAFYLAGLLALAIWSGRKQRSGDDYYLAGRDLSSLSLATSTIATQCSTNSLLGAPAFVGFVVGGGMVWLQYELAVPLAMLALAYLMLPIRRAGHVSIYAFLEERLGRHARLLASACFLLFRGVATGVTVYGVAIVLALLLDVSYTWAVTLLMLVTIGYDLIGGLRAVVISDVVQMVLIVAAVLVGLVFLWGDAADGAVFALDRASVIRLDSGFTGDGEYALWPMLIGGFFLYCAYYGCDQSQAQRVLASRSESETVNVLAFNGALRFPLVLLYCLLGLALASYAVRHPEFIGSLPTMADGAPNINLVFPAYVLQQFPVGFVGLVMVGIFAAAMSSIDSALNSLSAATVEDFWPGGLDSESQTSLWAERVSTVAWGAFAVVFSFQVENIAPTVLESINKIGSFANGPLLGLFSIALLFPGVGQRCAVISFVLGIAVNGFVSLWLPGVSWLWWNVIGFGTAFGCAVITSTVMRWGVAFHRPHEPLARRLAPKMLATFLAIVAICIAIDQVAIA